MMDWDDMRVFLALARMESLGRAGQQLRLDPATVGRRIARLEDELGRRLFTRSHQGYALTDAGTRMLPHAIAAEGAMMQASTAEGAAQAGLSGQIRIGAPDGCANFLLPQVVAAICAENPALDIQIIALPRVFNLSRREADMAIAVSRPQTGRLSVQKISDYKLHLAASCNYLAQHPAPQDSGGLQGHRIIGYIPDMIFDSELDYLAELGLDRVAMGSNSVAVQFNLIRQGAGLGVVHDFALPADPQLQRVLPQSFSLTRSFYLIRHLDDRHVPRLNRFAQRLLRGLKQELQRLETSVRTREALAQDANSPSVPRA